MVNYFIMTFFGFLILLSWSGWGSRINRLLLPHHPVDRWLHAGWGLAFTVMLFGWLNLFAIISKETIGLFLCAGVVLFIFDLRQGQVQLLFNINLQSSIGQAKNGFTLLLVLCVVFLLLIAYLGSVWNINYNPHDDFQGYFVFPEKMIQTGSLGSDPFSERRISSLQSYAALQAIVLSVGTWENLQFMDSGIAVLLNVGLLIGIGRHAGISLLSICLIVLFYLLIPAPHANSTSIESSVTLFLTLYQTLSLSFVQKKAVVPFGVIIGLIVAGLWGLKTTNIPASVLFVGLSYLLFWIRNKSLQISSENIIKESVFSALFTIVFLIPWMIDQYASCGTPLYPLLGAGYHGSVYGDILQPDSAMTIATSIEYVFKNITANPTLSFYAIGLVLVMTFPRSGGNRWPMLSYIVATMVSIPIVIIKLGGYGYYRYSYSFLAVGILIASIHMVAHGTKQDWKSLDFMGVQVNIIAFVMLFAGLAVGSKWDMTRKFYTEYLKNIVFGLQSKSVILTPGRSAGRHQDNPYPILKQKYHAIQHTVPAGETILTRLQYPFLLDFTRNTIYIADYPGGASPPPGMPLKQNAQALADYLLGQSIRYVAYSYQTQSLFSHEQFDERLSPDEHPWIRSEAQSTFAFQDRLYELGNKYVHIFDDGNVFVLDLKRVVLHM